MRPCAQMVLLSFLFAQCVPLRAAGTACAPVNCRPTAYNVAQIAASIKTATGASASITSRSCMWGGTAVKESGGNLCACNSNNFGVLQLSRQNIAKLGLTPEEYMLSTLQKQIDGWALAEATANNAAIGYALIDRDISTTVHFGHVMDGPLAACSQFGPAICNNDIKILESGRALPITPTDGAIRCKDSTCQNGTANQDGNGQTIVSWGSEIQTAIYASRCTDP
jgi:hypothetical protein